MSSSIATYALVADAKGAAGITAVLGTRVFPQRLGKDTALPAAVVVKIHEEPMIAHQGGLNVRVTRLQVSLFALTHRELETGISAFFARYNCFIGTLDGLEVLSCFVENCSDFTDEEVQELDFYQGRMDLVITWRDGE